MSRIEKIIDTFAIPREILCDALGVDSEVLEKIISGEIDLSLKQVNEFINLTGVSMKYLVEGKAINGCDRKVETYLKIEEDSLVYNNIKQEIIELLKTEGIEDLEVDSYFDPETRQIDAYQLLMKDNAKLFSVVSKNFQIKPNSYGISNGELVKKSRLLKSGSWEDIIDNIPSLLGTSIKNLEFVFLCTNGYTKILGKIRTGLLPFDITAIVYLLNNGAVLRSYGPDGKEYDDVIATLLLKDFCIKQL